MSLIQFSKLPTMLFDMLPNALVASYSTVLKRMGVAKSYKKSAIRHTCNYRDTSFSTVPLWRRSDCSSRLIHIRLELRRHLLSIEMDCDLQLVITRIQCAVGGLDIVWEWKIWSSTSTCVNDCTLKQTVDTSLNNCKVFYFQFSQYIRSHLHCSC